MDEAFDDKLRRLRAEVDVTLYFETLSVAEAQSVAEAIQGTPLLRSLDLQGSALGPRLKGGGLRQVVVLTAGLCGSSVTSLGLYQTGLLDEEVAAVAMVLRETELLHLDLGYNRIGVPGVRALAEGLKFSKVTTLALTGNFVGDEGVKVLASVLKETPVESLDLIHNGIGAEGARALAEGLKSSRVTTLKLYNNSLGDAGVAALAAALEETSLQSLGLGLNRFTDQGVKALAVSLKEASVTALGLEETDLGAEGAEALLEGLRDSAVTEIKLYWRVEREIRCKIQAVAEANKARSFVLQMEAQQLESEIWMKLRTIAGSEAVVLTWSLEQPVQDLPEAVLNSLRSSNFQLSFKGLSAVHLRLVRPDGTILDVGPAAESLAKQLGMEVEPSEVLGATSCARRQEGASSSSAS